MTEVFNVEYDIGMSTISIEGKRRAQTIPGEQKKDLNLFPIKRFHKKI
jgi:hypothetical protein